jgi:hypothetical protein
MTVNGFTLDFSEAAYGDVDRKRSRQPNRRQAMKTYITALALVFALATVTSLIALTVHGDHPPIDPDSHTAGHEKLAFIY